MSSGRKFTFQRMLPVSVPLSIRTCLDYWFVTLISSGTLFGFHWLVISFLPQYKLKYRLNYIERMPPFVKAMFGPDINEIISFTSMGAFAYMHPITLAVMMAMAIMVPSWCLVGQIDRGTIELTLATPTSRKKIVFTAILSSAIAGVILIGAMLLGTWVGIKYTELSSPLQFQQMTVIACNLYGVYLICMSVSLFFSAIFSTRSIAVGFSIAYCVSAYLMHFLSEWLPFVQKISFLGPLYYFRPIKIAAATYNVAGSTYSPWNDLAILVGISIVLQILATIWFSRRDIAVV